MVFNILGFKRTRLVVNIGVRKRAFRLRSFDLLDTVCSAKLERNWLFQSPKTIFLSLQSCHHLLVADLVSAAIVGPGYLDLESSVCSQLPEVCS